jgi:hypothetical protein
MRCNAKNDVLEVPVAAVHRRWRGVGVFATFFGMHPYLSPRE